MRFSHFTEATAYQCGTMSRKGAPWSGVRGWPFISYAIKISAAESVAWVSESDRTNCKSAWFVSPRTGLRWYGP